jgi:endoglucanase
MHRLNLSELGLRLSAAARPFVSFGLLTLGFLSTACITSRTGAYLNADEASATTLSLCPEGQIEDIEDGNDQILQKEGRGGYWFTFFDSEGSKITPKAELFAAGGPKGSGHYARAAGKMAASGASIYAGMGFNLADPKSAYDAGKYQGISFWAKGNATVRFKTPDAQTEPSGDKCTDCYNDFGVDIALYPEWTRFTVPFAKMKQQPGWGDAAPAVANDALFAVQWQVGKPGADFDVSIDNVEFVGCK